MRYYLGIDIGTSGTKAVCFDYTGKAIVSKTFEYQMTNPHPGYAEEKPSDWVFATKEGIKAITKLGYKIEGIGLSGQMHGLVLLDKHDTILRDSIIWCDNRAILETEELKKHFGPRLKEITGNDPVASFTLAKLLWVKKHEPEIFAKIAKVMLPKDYVRYMLTGNFISEYSDASGTQMLDIYHKCFSNEIIDYVGLSLNNFPRLIESVEISGYIKEELQTELGLSSKCFIVGGAGDQAAAAIGNGIVSTNDASIVLGSSGVVFTPISKDDLEANQLQVFFHAIPNTYHVMGVTNGCGLSYKWLKETLFSNKSYLELNALAEQALPLAGGLIYLPYLNGERTPHMDPYASGTFLGIRQNTTESNIIRAVLEGVAYSLKDCFMMLSKKPTCIHVSGGGAKGELWRKIIASTLQINVDRIKADEGGALGVAILAMVANQEYLDIVTATKKIIVKLDSADVNEEWAKAYEKGYKLYQKAYKYLKEWYKDAYKI